MLSATRYKTNQPTNHLPLIRVRFFTGNIWGDFPCLENFLAQLDFQFVQDQSKFNKDDSKKMSKLGLIDSRSCSSNRRTDGWNVMQKFQAYHAQTNKFRVALRSRSTFKMASLVFSPFLLLEFIHFTRQISLQGGGLGAAKANTTWFLNKINLTLLTFPGWNYDGQIISASEAIMKKIVELFFPRSLCLGELLNEDTRSDLAGAKVTRKSCSTLSRAKQCHHRVGLETSWRIFLTIRKKLITS